MKTLHRVLSGSRQEHKGGRRPGRSAARRSLTVLATMALALTIGLVAHPAGTHADPAPAATGAGHFQAYGGLRTFSFNAHLTGSGTAATGEAQLDDHATGRTFHLQIDCLAISGNTADVGGTVTSSNIPSQVGVHGIFSVRDNGQGANSPSDQMTLVYFYYPGCVYNYSGLYNDLDGGSIHVRG